MLSVCDPLNLFVVGGRLFFQYGDSVRSFTNVLLLTLISAHAREGYSSQSSVCLSICANNIWELTLLQSLKYDQMGEDHTLLALSKCADFLTNAAVSEKKQVKTWPIEIVLHVTPPLKVYIPKQVTC